MIRKRKLPLTLSQRRNKRIRRDVRVDEEKANRELDIKHLKDIDKYL